jgi:hypothetical protein
MINYNIICNYNLVIRRNMLKITGDELLCGFVVVADVRGECILVKKFLTRLITIVQKVLWFFR